jgi:hypothetical protein
VNRDLDPLAGLTRQKATPDAPVTCIVLVQRTEQRLMSIAAPAPLSPDHDSLSGRTPAATRVR